MRSTFILTDIGPYRGTYPFLSRKFYVMYIVIFFLASSNIDYQGKMLMPYELNLRSDMETRDSA